MTELELIRLLHSEIVQRLQAIEAVLSGAVASAAVDERRPPDAQPDADGGWFRRIVVGDWSENRRLCEDCWQEIPPYTAAPRGFVSPESGRKVREVAILDDKRGIEPLATTVCLPCYFEAFKRVYPGAALPDLPSEILKRLPAPEPIAVGRVSLTAPEAVLT